MESTKLIIMIIRGQEAVIPSGDTVLQAGDVLVMNEFQAKPHGSFSPLNSPEEPEPAAPEEPQPASSKEPVSLADQADEVQEQAEILVQKPEDSPEEK